LESVEWEVVFGRKWIVGEIKSQKIKSRLLVVIILQISDQYAYKRLAWWEGMRREGTGRWSLGWE